MFRLYHIPRIDAAYCYRLAWSVFLIVGYDSGHCRTAELMEMQFGEPKNQILDKGPDLPAGMGTFGGTRVDPSLTENLKYRGMVKNEASLQRSVR